MILQKGDKGEDVKTLQKYLHLAEDGIFGRITEDAVKAFQRAHGLKVDGIVGNITWGEITKEPLTEPENKALKKSKRTINEIIVHCSATPEGRKTTVEEIDTWHKQKGWSGCGYHYLIYVDGSIHLGRDVNKAGAHCSGHNTYSIGICYIGGVEGTLNEKGQIVPKKNKKGLYIDKDTRNEKQKASLIYLLKELRKLYPSAKIYGHHDFDKGKSCPCFEPRKEYANI